MGIKLSLPIRSCGATPPPSHDGSFSPTCPLFQLLVWARRSVCDGAVLVFCPGGRFCPHRPMVPAASWRAGPLRTPEYGLRDDRPWPLSSHCRAAVARGRQCVPLQLSRVYTPGLMQRYCSSPLPQLTMLSGPSSKLPVVCRSAAPGPM